MKNFILKNKFQTRKITNLITNTKDTFHYDLKLHDKYRTYKETYNDIIILKLESPLTFNKDVQKVCLPPDGWQHDYGITGPNGNQSNCWQSGWQFKNNMDGLKNKKEAPFNILRFEISLFYSGMIHIQIDFRQSGTRQELVRNLSGTCQDV